MSSVARRLGRPALAQDGFGLVVDGDDVNPAALGRPVDPLASDDGGRSGNGDLLAPACWRDGRPAAWPASGRPYLAAARRVTLDGPLERRCDGPGPPRSGVV